MFGLTSKISNIVAGGLGLVVIGLLIALMVTRGALDSRTQERDLARSELATEQAKHAVTRGSVRTLEAALAAKNAESIARAQAFEQAKAEGAAQVAAADARYKAAEGRREQLAAILRNPPSAVCKVPAGLLAGLEGL